MLFSLLRYLFCLVFDIAFILSLLTALFPLCHLLYFFGISFISLLLALHHFVYFIFVISFSSSSPFSLFLICPVFYISLSLFYLPSPLPSLRYFLYLLTSISFASLLLFPLPFHCHFLYLLAGTPFTSSSLSRPFPPPPVEPFSPLHFSLSSLPPPSISHNILITFPVYSSSISPPPLRQGPRPDIPASRY